MENSQKPVIPLRLVFQGSIPFEDIQAAEQYYTMLKEMVKTVSENSTLNGQIIKMLEPCCGKKTFQNLFPMVQLHQPPPDRQT